MPADILAAQQQFALVVHEQRRVHRAGVLAQGLEGADTLAQVVQPGGRRQGRAGQHSQFGQCLFHRFHATQAAAAGAGQLAALFLEVPERAAGDLHLGMLRRAAAAELQVIEFGGVMDNPAADAEADDKVFQVGGRDQHHRLADAVVGNGQRHLFGQRGFGGRAVIEVAVLVTLAGGGRGCCRGRDRAGLWLGVHEGITGGISSIKTKRGKRSRLIASTDPPIDAVDQDSLCNF